MFGYIRPVTSELKVKELDAFKSCYCGLCHVMGRKYGFLSRFLLNYDFVFLTMLLWDKDAPVEYENKRCIACPYKKKRCCKTNAAFETAAGLSIILSWWKIQDEITDEKRIKAFWYRVLSLFYNKAYKKAAAEFPEFDTAVRDNLGELNDLENNNCASMDMTADCFAKILQAASVSVQGDKARILSQVLYHTGRWIYIVDACDDLEKDIRTGSYNAVAARFDTDKLNDDIRNYLKTTLLHSRNLAGNSFELLENTVWTDTVRNIIFLGMPGVAEAVLTGKWKNRKTNHKNI